MNAPPGSTPPLSRLARKLDTRDAVVIGLGSMIGAGVFSAIGPATRAAGNAVVLGLSIAGGLAYCNATSSAALAALYPESGGAYVYGRKRLGALWGFLAGWGRRSPMRSGSGASRAPRRWSGSAPPSRRWACSCR
jgi:APA family basic amino acid/polyamine antiporter